MVVVARLGNRQSTLHAIRRTIYWTFSLFHILFAPGLSLRVGCTRVPSQASKALESHTSERFSR